MTDEASKKPKRKKHRHNKLARALQKETGLTYRTLLNLAEKHEGEIKVKATTEGKHFSDISVAFLLPIAREKKRREDAREQKRKEAGNERARS